MKYAFIAAIMISTSPVVAADSASVVELPAPTAQPELEGRQVAIDGMLNFRDVGGYQTSDGYTVRPHLFYRSDSPGRLSEKGQEQLKALGLRAIIDLRTNEERASDGNNWLATSVPGYWARDYSMSQGDLKESVPLTSLSDSQEISALMAKAYRDLPFEQAASYRELFQRLIDPAPGAVLVNCTSGKDRTGIGTALVLIALGVPYETVREDYLLSNAAYADRPQDMSRFPKEIGSVSPEAAKVLNGVEGVWLDSAIDSIQQRYETVGAYLDKELGMGTEQITALRTRLLTSAG